MRRNTPLERDVLADIRAVFARIPWLLVWRSNTGALRDEGGRLVRYGLCDGSSDLIGIVRLCDVAALSSIAHRTDPGVFLAIEVKRPGEKPTAEQRAFLARVAAMGGVAGWCSSVAGAVAIVHEARGYRQKDLEELYAAVDAVTRWKSKALRRVEVR